MLAYILQGIGYGFAAAVQPGPFQTYVVAQTLSRGWRRALPVALGPLISDGPIIVLTVLVLSQVPSWLERALHIAGGAFILYLAHSAFAAWRRFNPREPTPSDLPRFNLLRAAAMNALSPGPYIYWSLVTGPILLAGWRETPSNGLGFLAGFYLAMIAALGSIVLTFGLARRLGPRVNRLLLGVSAVALAGFGLHQLWLGLRSFDRIVGGR
jgi:threonine/homoserine/homoserine lactone efflux protein